MSHRGCSSNYSQERVGIPPTIMDRDITFSTNVSLFNGSFGSRMLGRLNKLMIKSTKNARVAALAATKK